MASLQITQVELAADPAPATGDTLRILAVELESNAGPSGAPSLAKGTVSPYVTVPGGTDVELSVVAGSGTTSTTWTPQAGSLPVDLAGTDTLKSFQTPYTPEGGLVAFAVTATGPGGNSGPVLMSVQVLPHPSWHLAGGVWAPTLLLR